MTRPTRALKVAAKTVFGLFLFFAAFCLCRPAISAPLVLGTGQAVLVAKAMVDWLQAGNFKRVMEEFTVAAKERLPQESLEAAWRTLNDRLGGFKAVSRMSSLPVDEGTEVLLVCEFAKAPVYMKVIFDFEQRVGSLQFSLSGGEPAKAQAAGMAPEPFVTPIATKQWAVPEPGGILH